MCKTAESSRLDINRLIALAESDPAQFEEMRSAAIEQLIQRASEKSRNRLRRVQWRVDRIRERAANPMAATIAISQMMWESFYQLHDHYQDLVGTVHGQEGLVRRRKPEQSAEIIDFPASIVPVEG